MKKKFVPAYTPCRIVNAKDRTYVLVYDRKYRQAPYRRNFKLNLIKNPFERAQRGHEIKQKIDWWLRNGYAFRDFDEASFKEIVKQRIRQDDKSHTPILDALKFARKGKASSNRKNTNKSYNSQFNMLSSYLIEKGMDALTSGEFSRINAIEYLDHYRLERDVAGTTYNNVIILQHGIWKFLVKRGYAKNNPFEGMTYLRRSKKRRRNFTPNEGQLILQRAYEQDRVLFYALLLLHGCLIRPAEMRRLRFHHVDLKNFVIIIEEEDAKNYKEGVIPIPDDYRPFFEEAFWQKYPGDYYIFGKRGWPHPNVKIGENKLLDNNIITIIKFAL